MHDHSERRRSTTSIVTLRDHIHFFVSLISQVIQSLDQSPIVIFEHIDKIGCFHTNLKKYGFKASMWDKLGECLIDALVVQVRYWKGKRAEGSRFFRPTEANGAVDDLFLITVLIFRTAFVVSLTRVKPGQS